MLSYYYSKEKKHSIYTYFEAIYFNLNEDRKDRRSVMLSYHEEGPGHYIYVEESCFKLVMERKDH